MKVLNGPLKAVSREARPYPAWLLNDCETGLCLFSAAFLGHNDAIHFARAGMDATCVDIDSAKLDEMRALYPWAWVFVSSDAWDYAQGWSGRFRWDAVSVDTWTGDLMGRSLNSLDLWCSLANKVVTVTHTAGSDYIVPDGWQASLFERATNVNWLVLTR